MNRTRWIGGIAAIAATVTALVLGGGTASADTGTGTATPGSNAKVCTVRIPALLAKIDRVTTRINGGASTKGSTAWLQTRQDAARASGRTALADLIGVRIANRSQRLADLAQVRSRVLKVQSTDCAS